MRREIPLVVEGTQYFCDFRNNRKLLFFARAAPKKLGIPLDPDEWVTPTLIQFTGNSGCCPNRLKVIRKVVSITLGWLTCHGPNFLQIRSGSLKTLQRFRKPIVQWMPAEGYSRVHQYQRHRPHRT